MCQLDTLFERIVSCACGYLLNKNYDRVGNMFERIKLNTFEDYFVPYSGRSSNGVYFCRLTKYNDEIHNVICKYIEITRKAGVCISEKIGNPDEKQLGYFDEIMGRKFQLNPNFFISSLKKWLPRIKEVQRTLIANCFYDIFIEMAREGKTENMQKNAYIKFMCWLYYKFEPILQELGNFDLPKILFEGYLNEYELKIMTILSKSGCDILLLEYCGDDKYLEIDAASSYSQLINVEGSVFPQDYSILELRKQLANKVVEPELKQFKPEKLINTNTWIQGDPFKDALCLQGQRGNDTRFFYSLYAGIYGVEDTTTYYADLLKWKIKMESCGNVLIIVEENIPQPTYEEINSIGRKNYNSTKALINDMVMQVHCPNRKFETYCQNAFILTMKELLDMPIQKLLNITVVLICWLNRYAQKLSSQQEKGSVFLFYGEVKGNNQELFFNLISQLPIDIIIINPESNQVQGIKNSLFYAQNYENTLQRKKFPDDLNNIQFGTVAYHAEQDLNTIMYQDTGVYKNQQFKGAVPIPLQIIYEEIAILWNQEAKYRPNFEVFDDKVMVPTIFSKVSGVQGSVDEYWEKMCELVSDDVFIIKEFPYANTIPNSFKDKSYMFLQHGKLEINKIKNHTTYPFAFIRESMQDYMLQKLQEMLDSKIIAGTGTNGIENLIVSTVLNMDMKLLRLIQKYDFTKGIPKVLVIHTQESNCSQEDGILLAYLNMIGFDIAMFVPTGYTSIERFYTRPMFVEHQVGEYMYDLQIPNFEYLKRKRDGFASKLFRRGR